MGPHKFRSTNMCMRRFLSRLREPQTFPLGEGGLGEWVGVGHFRGLFQGCEEVEEVEEVEEWI